MKASIIVPVYNTEKYLKRCIDSLVNQNFTDYEIIIINDSSTDSSESIINEYKDKKIKYIKNKKNMGIGYNRNLGIKESNGDFICFIDSDDYIDKNFLKNMYEKSVKDNLDMCICDYKYIYDDGKVKMISNIDSFESTNLVNKPELITKIPLGPCNKMFRKSTIIDNKITFNEKLKYEDIPFVLGALYYSNKIGKVDEVLNYFSYHENSETTTRDERVFDIFKELDIVKKLYKDSNIYLNELIISIVFNYTIQQRYQKDDELIDNFIDEAFDYLEKNNIDYKHSLYLIERPFYKSFIERSKKRSKLYCKLYKKIKSY